jgi:UDP-N-acetylmuramyl pentapeptide phosphotransferase/UDP-N-acetylglucosamine-1-phosphate transferase
MGDVGSTAIGFLFGALPLLPEARPVPFEPVGLALSLFFLDATSTLLRRMAVGETWYAPHRTHLYQRPVVTGASHRAVLLWAAAGILIVSGCSTAWLHASWTLRIGLLATPLLLFGAGQVAVGRLERRS